jgi:hypothetical protein
MPNDWNIDLAGSQGQPGTSGPAALPEAPTDGNLYFRNDYTWATSGTFQNRLTVQPAASNAQVTLNKSIAAGYRAGIIGTANWNARWMIEMGAGYAESGSNSGSPFIISSWTDAGVGTVVLDIDRPTGIACTQGLININNVGTGSGVPPADLQGGLCAGVFALAPASALCHYSINCYWNGSAWVQYQNGTSWLFQPAAGASGGLQGWMLLGSPNVVGPGGAPGFTGTYIISGDGWGINYANSQAGHRFVFSWNDIVGGLASVGVDGTAFYAIANANSDERLKQDIAASNYDCLATLERIPVHSYRWCDASEKPNEPREVERRDDNLMRAGLIAQRVNAVAAWLAPEPMPPPQPHQMHYWNVDANNLIALLVGALQQLTKRIEQLENA